MAEAYYEPTPATDGATMNPVPGAVFQVFEIADTTFATPLSLRVGSGNPTTTVTASDTLATLPGVYVTSPNYEHIWVSGSFQWRRDSIDGAKLAIEEAKIAASNSAAAADASADSAATSASLVNAPADTVMADVAGNPDTAFAKQQDAKLSKVTNPYPAFMRLKAVLAEAKASTGINIVTDSTGNTAGKTRWPFLFAPWLGSQYPNHAVQMLTWNNDTAKYDAPVVIQGSPRSRYSTFHGVAGSDHYGDGTAITGDIDVRVKVTFPVWPRAVNETLAGRWGAAAGQKGWYLQMRSYGQMLFGWSADGTNSAGSKESSAITVTAGTPMWLRATLTVATGNVAFYTAPDTGTAAPPTTWTAAGGGFGIGGVSTATSIFNVGSSWPYEIGADSNGTSNKFTGDIYEVEIRNGIDAPSVVPRYPDNWTSHNGTTTNAVTHKGNPVITILNGAAPGAALSYFTTTATLNKMTTPAYCSDVFILSEGHNEGWTSGWPYMEKLDTWINAIRAKTKRAEIVWTTQNPKSGGALYIEPHADRRRDQLTWAAKQDLSIIDVYRAFLDSPKGMSVLNEPDGTHPSDSDGSPLWADVIKEAFAQSR